MNRICLNCYRSELSLSQEVYCSLECHVMALKREVSHANARYSSERIRAEEWRESYAKMVGKLDVILVMLRKVNLCRESSETSLSLREMVDIVDEVRGFIENRKRYDN